jgi:hypothetical protein
VRHRRKRRTSVGRHGVEEAGASTGEALGEGGMGVHRWRGYARCRRKWHSQAGRRGAEETGARDRAARGRFGGWGGRTRGLSVDGTLGLGD